MRCETSCAALPRDVVVEHAAERFTLAVRVARCELDARRVRQRLRALGHALSSDGGEVPPRGFPPTPGPADGAALPAGGRRHN
jgi:hypothetical protein